MLQYAIRKAPRYQLSDLTFKVVKIVTDKHLFLLMIVYIIKICYHPLFFVVFYLFWAFTFSICFCCWTEIAPNKMKESRDLTMFLDVNSTGKLAQHNKHGSYIPACDLPTLIIRRFRSTCGTRTNSEWVGFPRPHTAT